MLAWNDVLHEGPVPEGPRGSLLASRAAFLASCGWGKEATILAGLERRDGMLLGALRGGAEAVLWFEHDLYDQLQLVDVLALVAAEPATTEALSLIVVGSFPGHPGFRGLGELNADELETLWPLRVRAAHEMLSSAGDIWAAVRSPTPLALARLVADEVAGLPFAAPALRRLLEELPAVADGLSVTERRALESVAAGAVTPAVAFTASQAAEPAPFLGDAWFFRTLAALGAGAGRLVETEAGEPLAAPPPLGDGARFPSARLRLTAAGRRVLAGELDRVEALAVDRWVGGTHVAPETVWRWDAAAGRPVAPHPT